MGNFLQLFTNNDKVQNVNNINSINGESQILGYPTFFKKEKTKKIVLTANNNYPTLTNNLYTIIIPDFISVIENGAFNKENPESNLKWKIKTVIFEHNNCLPEFNINEFEKVEKFIVCNENIKNQLEKIYKNVPINIENY